MMKLPFAASTIVVLLTLLWIANAGLAQQKSNRSLSFTGEQNTVHSKNNRGQRGFGHQGITKGGKQWFLFGTENIYRYDDTNFRANQAALKVKNEAPFGHADFKESGISHLGAPHYHEGQIYTFTKTSNDTPYADAVMRLVWYRADDLSYQEGSFRRLTIPPDKTGNHSVVAGGPYIVGDVFFAAMTKRVAGKPAQMREIGKFSLKTGKYLGVVELSYWYSRPQALVIDNAGNFYVMETRGHLKKFSPKGKYLGTIFRGAVPAVYEGFYLDGAKKLMTLSITKGGKVHGEKGRGIFIVEINLGKK